jgi:O-antigen/teichoic acid export membrane protein
MDVSLRRVFGNAGWFLGSRTVVGLLSLFYIGLAARTLGLSGFGAFALVVGLGQAIAGFVTFQTWQIVVRYGMPHFQAGEHDRLDDLILLCALLDAASALAGALLATIAILILAPWFGWTPAVMWQAGLFCAAMLLSLRSTPIGMLRLHDRFAAAAASDSVTPIVRLIGAGVAAICAPGVAGFLIAWACAEIATAIACWWFALKHHPLGLRSGAMRRVLAREAGILRFAWLTNAGSTLSLSVRQLVLLIVGSIGGAAFAGDRQADARILTRGVPRTGPRRRWRRARHSPSDRAHDDDRDDRGMRRFRARPALGQADARPAFGTGYSVRLCADAAADLRSRA